GERFEKYFFDFARKYGIRDMYSGGFYPFPDEETRWAWWARHIYNTQEIVRNIDDLYASDDNICIFPAGLVSRRIDGVVQDLPWKKNFIEKAYANQIPIVPVYVDAQNTNFFYSVANIRKKIGIKFNYELVLLPSELFKYSGKPIGLYFGKPIMPETLAAFNTPAERTLKVRELTYCLKQY
ncbi:MAG: hypothetical protein K6F33_13115, partial [Bacteroidales bacterium]|nr:hypothetical protein [Bacteroidales bacterium]